MKKVLFTVIILYYLPAGLLAQNWSAQTLAAANTAVNASYLTSEEKSMVFYLNLIRLDGALFLDTYFKQYVEQHNEEMRKYSNYHQVKIDKRSRYYKSLEADLKKIRSLPLLLPDEKMSAMSAAHAEDLGRHNRTSHDSSNGQTFAQRINKIYPNTNAAENLAFGSMTALDIMCSLLLDENVPGLGHRKNILNSTAKFTHVGVAIKAHPTYRLTGVMDFVSLRQGI